MPDFVRDNAIVIIAILLVIILLLLRDALRQRGGVLRVWRAFALRFRRRFEREYLDMLLDTQRDTPALLVKGDLTSLELVKAFATLRVQIEGTPESDAEAIEPAQAHT